MGSLFKTPKMQTVQAPVAQEVETESEEVAKKKRRADAREYTTTNLQSPYVALFGDNKKNSI